MAMTVRQLVDVRDLGLRVVAGHGGLDNPITLAHAIEVSDVRPWLGGSELLMTTGMGLGPAAELQSAYVENLAQVGVAGLAFGIGMNHPSIPEALVRASDKFEIPLLEVPVPTPFIAITKAVTAYALREQQESLRAVIAAQRSMTSKALQSGFRGVLGSIRTALGCEAALFDLHGDLVAAVGDDVASLVAQANSQMLHHARNKLPLNSAGEVDGGHLLIQVLAVDRNQLGCLAVRSAQPVDEGGRLIIGHAISVLCLELIKPSAVVDAERALQSDVLSAILSGSLNERDLRRQLNGMGFATDQPVTVAVATSTLRDKLFDIVHAAVAPLRGRYVVSLRDDDVVLLCSSSAVDSEKLSRAIRKHSMRAVHLGVSRPVAVDSITDGLRQARFAAHSSRAEGRAVRKFDELSTYSLLLSLHSPDTLQTIADSALAPLREAGAERGELIESLDAFLTHNAHWLPAAEALGVHRHTLRNRMRRVEELTGRALSSAHDRTELWLALKAQELRLMAGDAASPENQEGARAVRSLPERTTAHTDDDDEHEGMARGHVG